MTRSGWGRAAFVLVVAVLFVTALVQVWTGAVQARGGPVLESLLVAGFTLPLLVARRAPLLVLLVVLTCSWADHWLGGSLGQPWFALLLVTYQLGRHGRTVEGVVGGTVLAAALLAVDLPRLQDGAPIEDVVPGWFIVAATFAFGRWMQRRELESLALRRTADEERRQAEVATREAVADERARIARELHDLVAHSLAVIVVQAQGGSRALDSDLAQARIAFGAIEGMGRDGLGELRRLLDVLDTAGSLADEPSPGLPNLDELADRVRATGLPVAIEVEGAPRRLPPGLELSAYRIVQEALTNTLKHAGPAQARVGVRYLPNAVEIDVTDDGAGTPVATGGRVGHGLIGMRERVALYGGTLVARRSDGGGFEVRATFPVEPA